MMARRWRRLGRCGLAALLVVGLFVVVDQSPSFAQIRRKTEVKTDEPDADAIALPRNPEAKRLIQAARDYIKLKEWRTAAECLQALLETPDDSFIEVKRTDAKGVEQSVKTSVRDEANRILGELPADGLESYQIQYGQAAADRLREALERADPTLLAEVAQRYQHTKAGIDATNMLGTMQLDRGQYLMAMLCFERLLTRPDADKLPPKTLFKAALAYRRAGDTATADKLLTKVIDKVGRGELTLGRVRLSAEQLRAELTREIGVDPSAGGLDWPMFRGHANRNGRLSGSTAFLEPSWTASTVYPEEPSPSEKSAAEWIEQHLDIVRTAMKDRPILPAFFPITVGGKMLARTYDGVAAYALEPAADSKFKPGDLVWRTASADRSLFATVHAADNGKRIAADNWYDNYYRSGGGGPLGVFFENSVIGSISTDGRRVYYIDDLGLPPHANMMAMSNMGNPVIFAPFADEIGNNRLFAAYIDGGKLAWSPLGGKSTEPPKSKDAKEEKKPATAATELMDSFFLGPPLPLGGKLYLLCEKAGEIRLVGLDAERYEKQPELMWVQTLGTAHTRLPNDGWRRLHACHLAYGDGILVCPTNSGAIVGVDLLTHSLVWAYSYRKAAPTPVNDEMAIFNRRMNRGVAAQPPERWRPSAPCIVKDKVVVASYDASEVLCLSLRDGRKLWSVPREESHDLYLAGVFDGRVLVVAKNGVRAYDLETGGVAWTCKDIGLPTGQGAAGEGFYFLPVASNSASSADKGAAICAIDIKTGRANPPAPSRQDTPGNLVFAGGVLISQSIDHVSSFPLLKVKQDDINRRLARNPRDPTGLADRGELLLYDGKVREGIADLRTALTHQPSDAVRAKARAKLYDGLTRWLQADFAAAQELLNEYEELTRVDVPADASADQKAKLTAEGVRRRATYLELVGRGRERQGKLLEAFAAYEQYSDLPGRRELVESLEEPTTRARPDIWARGRIQAMLAAAKPDDRKQLEAEIARRLEAARSAAGLEDLRRFVNLFGSSSDAGLTARLELVKRLLATEDADNLNEAERLLLVQCFAERMPAGDSAGRAKALDLMIQVCVRRGQFENAVGYAKRLGAEFGDVVVRDGKTGKQMLDELASDKRFIPYLDAPAVQWPTFQSGRDIPSAGRSMGDMNLTIEPQGELSPFLERHRIVLQTRESGIVHLRVLDRATGEERWKTPQLPRFSLAGEWQSPTSFAFARGQTVILQLGHVVVALDVARNKELWRRNLLGTDALTQMQEGSLEVDQNNMPTQASAVDGSRRSVGRVAIVEAAYVCLQTRDGLIAVDPELPGPSVLWSKADVSATAQVFGDSEHVYVFELEKGQPRIRILRAADGSSIKPADSAALAVKIRDALAKKLRIVRGAILVSDSGGKVIRLVHPLTGEDRWKREFAQGAVAAQSNDRHHLGIVEPDGLFSWIDLGDGSVRFTSRFRPADTDRLTKAAVIADRDRIYVALERQAEPGMQWHPATNPNTMATVRVNGPVYAISKRTGKQEWISEPLPHQALLMDQIGDLPLLIFVSQYNKSSANGQPEKQGLRVAAVSKTNGKMIADQDITRNETPFHAIVAKPSEGKIELQRLDRKVIFSASPPQPPAMGAAVKPSQVEAQPTPPPMVPQPLIPQP